MRDKNTDLLMFLNFLVINATSYKGQLKDNTFFKKTITDNI